MKRVFTADSEEPDCSQCDYFGESPKIRDGKGEIVSICDRCGPKYWWRWYRRTVDDSLDKTGKPNSTK